MSVVIITYDIGGKIFKVSKDLLNKYPDTMLCMVTSEIETSNYNEPIFIDGNSERFPYILDYMKFQEVELPLHIGKKSFIKELDYYGFHNIKLKDIDTLSQKFQRQERMSLVASKCMVNILDGGIGYHSIRMNGWQDNVINNSELGLHIIFDSKHEEHEQYCSTLTSILSKHNTTIKWMKGPCYLNTPSSPFLKSDGKREVTIRTY